MHWYEKELTSYEAPDNNIGTAWLHRHQWSICRRHWPSNHFTKDIWQGRHYHLSVYIYKRCWPSGCLYQRTQLTDHAMVLYRAPGWVEKLEVSSCSCPVGTTWCPQHLALSRLMPLHIDGNNLLLFQSHVSFKSCQIASWFKSVEGSAYRGWLW